MLRAHRFFAATLAVALAPASPLLAQTMTQASAPTIAQFLSPAEPLELTSAKKADRVAWVAYEKGMRNVYTAAAPNFRPVRLTRFLQDDGIDLTDVSLSDNGAVAVFIRGSAPNRQGFVANPEHNPNGTERAIWAVRTDGSSPAVRVAEAISPEVSPDGRYVLYVKDGQIYRGRTTPISQPTAIDKGEKPFIDIWGRNSSPRWSPDGSKIAFVSDRTDHAFIAIYDMATRTVDYVTPSVDRDGTPEWSADGKSITFTRRPGTPFGQQSPPGSGSGLPDATGGRGGGGGGRAAGGRGAAAAAPAAPNPCGGGGGRGAGGRGGAGGGAAGGGGGRGGRGGAGAGAGAAAATDTTQGPTVRDIAGMCTATLDDGSTLEMLSVNLADRKTTVLWRNNASGATQANLGNYRWGAGHIIFSQGGRGGGGGGRGRGGQGGDEWDRYYSMAMDGSNGTPVLLTTTDGLIEDATSVALSSDGKTFYYCTNAQDIERRHIWAVPVSGGEPKQISQGDGVERAPSPLSSGKQVAVLYFNWNQPASVALVPAEGGAPKIIFPTLPADFPVAAHVKPEIVITHAADGLEIHNQLFLPKGIQPGEQRPTMIFVHGGPQRQMLPAYHYMQFYHWAYAVNEWLASQGYIVMSINYRSGIGYGNSFRSAPGTGARGNSEYQDVLAGAEYLRGRTDVDAKRLGIWGLSYGGLLTSEALSRNSDIFIAGADLAGVHLQGSSLDVSSTSYQASSIAEIDKWKSPVFLVQGDDDRNVNFAQMVGLVQLLRQRDVYYELTVIPDDLHESMVDSRWINTWTRMGEFLHRFVWNAETPPSKPK
jgi:dipeptidyl-peptidase 4